ncbi:MAG: D-2-hydroxyacid dehydrogenase [Bacteroidia bacterium]|nr:D-2-hydroxyacid dehydrogenase [Bacteroidia bacterium]
MEIFIHQSLDLRQRDFLEKNFPGKQFVYGDDLPKTEREKAFMRAEVVFGNVSSGWISRSENLRWIQLASAGVNQYIRLDWENLSKKINLTNLSGFFGISVAETALAGILALYRRIDHLARLQVSKTWRGKEERELVRTLWQKKVVILGPGAIGGHLKRLLLAFDCEVIMYGRRRENADIITAEELDQLLPGIDILVAALPETEETINFLNRQRLALLSPAAMLVSMGRGSVLDETALAEMLHSQKLLGAVVDVTIEEPLPEDHAFWTSPCTLLTQHTSGGFEDEVSAFLKFFVANLHRYIEGNPLVNIVDWKKGY